MKKGFTLIELLAVIIILAIVALIATPIILDVVDDAKDSAAISEASMVVSGVNNYCAAAEMREQLNGTLNICKDGVTTEEVATMVDLGNAKINEIEYTNGKVSKIEVESNGRTVKYDGLAYSIDGENITYVAYSAGDEVTLTDGTSWLVVKDSAASESEIKLMSISNVKNNLTTETGTAMFTIDSGESQVFFKTYSWDSSALKVNLEETIKPKLENSIGNMINDITIIGTEELIALGCTVTKNGEYFDFPTCDSTVPWYSKLVNPNIESWTKLSKDDKRVYYISSTGFSHDYPDNFNAPVDCFWEPCDKVISNSGIGIRPVITVSKTVISQ